MSWRERAACKGADPELFFPKQAESVAPALAYCERCEVQEECLRDALSTAGAYTTTGVWGGTLECQRSGTFTTIQTMCERCGISFRKLRPTQKYCTVQCRNNAASAAAYRRKKAS